ncbi:AbrB family transcriptional regulator [Celeribacter litoreus]|uniref:AbrB family transcriptional regulator n=1 Tax=Celeribacter litoreus TaxID=2876714 RepID=UPI001CCB2BC6|nr:AbrB family transcriptional regulator [Celeribacter litoreus]MCA0044526.1 AbrB family transcriptional regulator [Celeribacter litoreus]
MPLSIDASKLLRPGLTLVVGTIGGTTAYLMKMPLPWMLGPMVFVFAAVMFKAPLESPGKLRPYVIPVIGVMLGSGFDTDTFGHLARWGLSLAGLSLYLACAAALVVPFYIKIGKLDPITAFFSAMPGGLSEMTVIGSAMGGDEKRIILAHAGRILISIALIAFWFRIVLGYEVTGTSPTGNGEILTLKAAVILLGCAVAGTLIGEKLKLPAPGLLGPLLLSAAVHMTGLTHSQPPALLIIAAQIILGATMGSRFRGAEGKLVAQTLLLTFGGTVITLALSLIFALVFHGLFAQSVEQVLLAYAPGGLTEMSLVALAMNAEVAYISIHHLVRIVLIIAIAPTVLTKIASRIGY